MGICQCNGTDGLINNFINDISSDLCGASGPINECDSTRSCSINCNHINGANCKSATIDGRNAKNFQVYCTTDDACDNTVIYCPTGFYDTCQIKCTANACNGVEIYGYTTQNNQYDNVTLMCDGIDACSDVLIYAFNTYSINIVCNGQKSCKSINVLAHYAYIIEVNAIQNIMNESSVDETNLVCDHLHISSKSIIDSLTVICDGSYACGNIILDASKTSDAELYILANGTNALYYGSIHIDRVIFFELNCYSNNSCYYPSIYTANERLSDTKPKINCYENGCEYLNIYALNGLNDFDIQFNNCSECFNSNNCIDNWNLFCGEQSTDEGYVYYITNETYTNCVKIHTIFHL